ncbi:hypothetical protein M4951_23695 [Blastopirellula sp. J2-11]|uniref:hypothetical protein n=1 Tax=Blastopirellula sp. J2-11 TaxID=2943192 RepID=UPI0021C66BB2|nr:hypothetical protein [Blastopirellula sp. J2-11]UUO06339.1 hypothetical protein M4951_23695 [Blastopirellula sp. J2-11]
MSTKSIQLGVIALLALYSMGCSRSDDPFDRADASGIVTLDGKPLAEGVVYFIPKGGIVGPKAFATVTDGTFSAEGDYAPLVGNHRIEIESRDDGGIAFDDEKAVARLVEEGRKPPQRVVVPPIYNQRSILSADVVADGPNEFKFELSSKRRR